MVGRGNVYSENHKEDMNFKASLLWIPIKNA